MTSSSCPLMSPLSASPRRMIILEWSQTADDEWVPNGQEKGLLALGCSHLCEAMSDGFICPVSAKQDYALEEMYPLPKPPHVQNSSKKGHVGIAFPGLIEGLAISRGF